MKSVLILILAALFAIPPSSAVAGGGGGGGKHDQLTSTLAAVQANRKLMQESGLDVTDIIYNETMLNATTNATLDGNTTSEAPATATTPPENDRASIPSTEPTAPIEESPPSTGTAEIPAVDCVGEWQDYETCNYLEEGHQNQRCRSYRVLTVADAQGLACPHDDGEIECDTDGCSQPIDCVGDWQAYGSCAYDDGDGKSKRCRTYSITRTSAYSGYECPYEEGYEECDISDCVQPISPGNDCDGGWGSYGNCYYNEGSHKNVRCRTYNIYTNGGGGSCPYPQSYEECTTNGCSQPLDCVGAWLPYEGCAYDEAALQNQRCRRYRVTRASAYNGYECPQIQNAQQCVTSDCAQPIACVGGWRPYRSCNEAGQKCRTYAIRRQAAHSGYECPYQENFEQCVPCPQIVEDEEDVFGSASASGNVPSSEIGNTTASSVAVLDPRDGSFAFTLSSAQAALHSVLAAVCSTILFLLL